MKEKREMRVTSEVRVFTFPRIDTYVPEKSPDRSMWCQSWYQKGLYYDIDKIKLARKKFELNLYRDRYVPLDTFYKTKESLESLISEFGLNLPVKMVKRSEFVLRCIDDCLVRKNVVDDEKLDIKMAGKPTASLVLLNKYVCGNLKRREENTFGIAVTGIGYVFLPTLKEEKRVLEIARHELVHLLGYGYHHNNRTVRKVKGYTHISACLMHTTKSYFDICTKCKEAIVAFWKGLEENTGKRFFK